MPALYSNNFDSEALGTLPGSTFGSDSNFPLVVASASAQSITAVSGTQVAGFTAEGNTAYFTATTSYVGQDIRCEYRATFAHERHAGPVVRWASSGQFYLAVLTRDGAGYKCHLYRSSGGFPILGTTAVVPCVEGDTLCLELTANGTNPVVLDLRLWLKSGSRPSTPSLTANDSSAERITAGAIGFGGNGGGAGFCPVDNVVYGDGTGGLDTFGGGGPATAITLSGPSSGTVGVASSNFTVGADGTITGTITVTPSDGGDGGTFSPTTVNISAGTPTATFTYTAANAGSPTATITVTNNGGLTNPAGIAYTATAPAATSLVVTVPDAAGLSGFAAAVLSTSTPTTGSTVIKTATGLTFNGSGQATIDITGLGVAIGARRWVTLSNSTGDPAQTPAPKQASGPVAAS